MCSFLLLTPQSKYVIYWVGVGGFLSLLFLRLLFHFCLLLGLYMESERLSRQTVTSWALIVKCAAHFISLVYQEQTTLGYSFNVFCKD